MTNHVAPRGTCKSICKSIDRFPTKVNFKSFYVIFLTLDECFPSNWHSGEKKVARRRLFPLLSRKYRSLKCVQRKRVIIETNAIIILIL